ncbi:hypothetical protein GC176_00935 [bacterium]|nr:hypothetical protein [bacterium]
MKHHRLATALSITFLFSGLVTATLADDGKEEPKPVPLPAAEPQLSAILPAGLQQGTSAEVTVTGRSLISTEAVTVDGRGITAEIVPLPESSRPNANSVTIRLTAAADAEPGIHELRLRTPGGTSNVLRFEVGLLPQILETEPNDDDGSAEKLATLPVIVNGALNRGEDRDCFRFSAKQGQTIVLDLSGQKLHPYISNLRPGWLEAVLTVRDSTEIAPLADENAAAQKLLAEKTSAASRAASVAKSRRDAAQQAVVEKNEAVKVAATKIAAAEAAAEVAAQAQSAAEKMRAQLAAAEKNAADFAASKNGDTDKSAADQAVAKKKQAVELARKAATEAKSAADKAMVEKEAADKLVESRVAAEKAALERSNAAATNAKKASDELITARTRASDAAAVLEAVFNPSVRNLAVASYFAGRYDPALMFTAPRDGEFVVEVRDDLFRSRAEFTYRLTIGELPFVTQVFPAGAKRGQATTIQLDGANLGDQKSLTTTLASDASLERSHFEHLTTPLGPSNLVTLQPGDAAEFLEAEPNNEVEQATAVEVPGTLNGVIAHAGDFDCYRFTAQKGQTLVFETVSRAFDSPLDARLELFDARGRQLRNNDDFSSQPDARIDYTFNADGEYVIRVGDTTSLGSPSHVYRLRVREPKPDFALTVNPDNPRVSAGGAIALTVMIERLDGFKDDVKISIPNPPPGAIVSPAVINTTQSEVTLSLSMPADAAAAVYPLTVSGRSVIDDQEVTHQAVPVERMRYINEWRYVPVADLSLSVLPQAPFTLEWDQPDVTIEAGKTVEVPVKLHRTPGFDSAVRIVTVGLPSGVYAPVITIDKDATEGVVELRSSGSARAGTGNAIAAGTVSSFTQNSAVLAVTVKVAERK